MICIIILIKIDIIEKTKKIIIFKNRIITSKETKTWQNKEETTILKIDQVTITQY